jgi:histidine triad (HIT) family protein
MCIFCQIANNEIPHYKFYENDQVAAFLDIQPVNPGHTLVIPKKHYDNIEAIGEQELSGLIIAVKHIGRQLLDKLNIAGYNVLVNNGAVAGQAVAHLHFHLIPRQAGDTCPTWPHASYAPGEAEELLKKLQA